MLRALIQGLSGVLMVPMLITVLGAALLAAGVLLGEPVLIRAAEAVVPRFLPLVFALGVITGLAGGDAWAALAATVAYGVVQAVATHVSGAAVPLYLGAPGGLAVGGAVAWLHHRFRRVELPEALALFSGGRLVLVLALAAALPLGLLLGWAWPYVLAAAAALGQWAYAAGPLGAFVYGAGIRLLVPLGLHHVVNLAVDHLLGLYGDPATGALLMGEVPRFLAGDPAAGRLLSGLFITYCFGIPGIALAIGLAARPAHRRRVLRTMAGGAAGCVLAGVSEPVDFAYAFAAPALWVASAVLSGLASAAAYALGIRHWGLAAPLFLINLHRAERPWLLPLLGIPFFLAHLALFYGYIRVFRPAVPGQEGGDGPESAGGPAAEQILAAVGGAANVAGMVSCVTRLRLQLRDDRLVDAAALRALGVYGVVRLGGGAVQVVVGQRRAAALGEELARLLGGQAAGTGAAAVPPGDPEAVVPPASPGDPEAVAPPAPPGDPEAPPGPAVELVSPLTGTVVPLSEVPDPVFAGKLAGDGVAVLPAAGELVAPCAGEVVHVAATGHAVGLMGPGGLEILLHIGIDTVRLHGAGFTPLVRAGDRVRTGQPLIRFDVAAIAAAGRSPVTPVLITNPDRLCRLEVLATGRVEAGRTPLLRAILGN